MADALKDCFSPAMIRRLGATLAAAAPTFPTAAFVARAIKGLEPLTLLARARHIADAMAATLAPTYPEALANVLHSLGPAQAAGSDEDAGSGMGPFFHLRTHSSSRRTARPTSTSRWRRNTR